METSKYEPSAEASEVPESSETIESPDAYSEDGIDVSLIHWMLELSPM